jgi:hypothetical protein
MKQGFGERWWDVECRIDVGGRRHLTRLSEDVKLFGIPLLKTQRLMPRTAPPLLGSDIVSRGLSSSRELGLVESPCCAPNSMLSPPSL